MGTNVIIWNSLCGSEGAEVRIWENGDFNACFEKLIFSVLPHIVLILFSSYHFTRHQHLRRRGLITRYLTLHVRQVVCLLIISSALFLFSIKYAYNRTMPPLVYIIWGLVYTFCWLVHSCYVWRLHRLDNLSLRGCWPIVLATFFVFACHLVLLRTAILKRIYNTQVFDDFEEIFVYITTAFHVAYISTFVRSKRTVPVSGLLTSPPSSERLLNSSRDRVIHSNQICPEDMSWFLPKLFFCWINSLMRKGYKGDINTVEDLFNLPEDLQTSNILQYFYLTKQKCKPTPSGVTVPDSSYSLNLNPMDQLPNNEVTSGRQESQNPIRLSHQSEKQEKCKTLLRLLLTAFGWEYFPLGTLKFFSDACSFCNPILLNLLITYISSPKDNSNRIDSSLEGYLYCFGLFLATFLGSLASTHFDYRISRVALKFRSVIVDSIYKKTLSTSQVDLRSEFSTGEVINLMSTDADRVVGFCPSFHQFWSLPIQVCVVLYLLYLQVGLAFLSGVGFAVLLIPVNRWIAIKIGQLSKTMMSQKDARVKLINESFQGIRTVKFHAWEDVFIRRIEVIRSSELSSLMKRKYLDALCVFFWAATPIAISTLTFTTYVLMDNSLTAAKVFTSISLFAILITPLNAFPWVVNGLMEAWVSLNRIQRLLDLDDLDLSRHYDLYLYYLGFLPTMSGEVVLKMKDTSFTWFRDAPHLWPEIESNSFHTLSCDFQSDDDDDDALIEVGSASDHHHHSPQFARVMKINLYKLNLDVKQGMLVGIVGAVGSGKSSLLSAVLGEMRRVQSLCPSSLSLGFSLDEGFGYFSQEPWVQRGTLKGNILFGKKFNPQMYLRVILACALDSDIAMLPDGDSTEIGESGVTLSGGQKARVALARTAYQNKNFYLLDDPYSSLDVHVASRIHSGCIMGLLGHTTRLVVTHHVHFLKDADFIVVMEKGKILRSGLPSHLNLESFEQSTGGGDDDDLSAKRAKGEWPNCDKSHHVNKSSDRAQRDDDDDELINLEDDVHGCHDTEHNVVVVNNGSDEESKQTGVVRWRVYTVYWRAVGNCLALCVLLSLFLMQASRNTCDWWLSYWVTHASNQSDLKVNETSKHVISWDLRDGQSSSTRFAFLQTSYLMNDIYRASMVVRPSSPTTVHNNNTDNYNSSFYLIIYGSLAGFNALATILRAVLFAVGGIEAAKIMHNKLLDSIFKASIKFFDVTSLGRIINRFSSDVFSVDDSLPFVLNIFLAQSFGLLGSIVICCYGLPFSVIAIALLSIIYYCVQKYYRHTSRELKRISCITLSPIYAHFSETLAGLPVIRAHRVASRFEREALTFLDLNQRAQFASTAIVQWLNIRFQMIGVALVTSVSLISVLQREYGTVSPGLVGLAISYVLSITSLLGGLVLSFTETEKMMIAVERVDDYINDVPHEDCFSNLSENIPVLWPFVGVITFNDVTLRYGADLPDVLRGVTFETHPGERVGVVGRTGSGKSSLFLALMRLVPIIRGKIYIDGVDVHSLPLREFRSRISMIPQDPFLFSGTVRENLDPGRRHKDTEIKRSLSRCNMLEMVELLGGLEAKIEERGQQFSSGQRQLLCLARTMLSASHVLCIDEAMASVDMATDRMLQATLKRHFRGRTVIAIAHRIESILDYDRIVVMNHGKLVEFGTPAHLSSDPSSLFSKLLRAKDQST